MVITATSLWATCESSWASTPSSSSGSSRRSRPVVTQTTELFWLRPVAKALGMSLSATATRGLGMSASAQSRSMVPCSCGYCSGVTSPGPHRPFGDLVAEPELGDEQPAATISTISGQAPRSRTISTPMKHHVEQADQEHGGDHAARQPAVRGEARSVHVPSRGLRSRPGWPGDASDVIVSPRTSGHAPRGRPGVGTFARDGFTAEVRICNNK